MRTTKRRLLRLLAVPVALSMLAAACGGSEETAETTEPEAATTTEARQVNTDTGEQPATTVAAEVTTTTEPIPPASGTLRMVDFTPVNTFNPAGAQVAQSIYLYPAYDTLTRQINDLTVVPALATGWSMPDDVTWEFTLRDDVVFHDGAAFNAQVAVDNVNYHASFEGNPNASTWSSLVEARVVDDTTFQVEFSRPKPEFPLEMSMVMGMMISPNALDGSDLTRNPQGSGPWIWSEEDSEAGVTEVYNLNPEHWNPADQGVEQVRVTSVPDNNARMNALLTGEADIMATARDPQIQNGRDAGMELISVPNYFPYITILDRGGQLNPVLADIRVRQAILKAVDLEAYNDSIHGGNGDAVSGIYPPAFGEFHDPALAVNTYDPEGAKALLAEAGYPDGVTIHMPTMPVISAAMDLIAQMLGAVGITVELDQINNGELGGRMRSGQSEVSWSRALLVHPAMQLGDWVGENAPSNPFNLTDTNDMADKLQEALRSDPDTASALYSEIARDLIDIGAVIPLGHAGLNAMYAPNVTGVSMGLNMQAPMPYGIRVDG